MKKHLLNILLKIISRSSVYQKNNSKNNVKNITRLYSSDSFNSSFAKIRFWDAPLIAIEQAMPKKGIVLDLGCGEGILTNYIAISGPKRKVIGIEINKNRIRKANKGLKNVSFINGDILNKNIPKADTIVLSNVLHHLPTKDDQALLLYKCSQKITRNGKILISEIAKELSPKYLLVFLVDAFVVPILFEGKIYDPFLHRSEGDWSKLLSSIGLSYKIKKITKGPFPDMLIVAEKK